MPFPISSSSYPPSPFTEKQTNKNNNRELTANNNNNKRDRQSSLAYDNISSPW